MEHGERAADLAVDPPQDDKEIRGRTTCSEVDTSLRAERQGRRRATGVARPQGRRRQEHDGERQGQGCEGSPEVAHGGKYIAAKRSQDIWLVQRSGDPYRVRSRAADPCTST